MLDRTPEYRTEQNFRSKGAKHGSRITATVKTHPDGVLICTYVPENTPAGYPEYPDALSGEFSTVVPLVSTCRTREMRSTGLVKARERALLGRPVALLQIPAHLAIARARRHTGDG